MPKYKFTEIAINSTEKKKPTEADKDTYIGLEHLDSGTLTVTRWGAEVAPIGEKLVMKKGDVLFGKRRAYQKKVGIAPFDGIFSAHGMVLRPREEVITKEYFPLFISSDYFLNEAIRISVGSLSPTVNWKDLKDLEFFIPSIEEQRRLTPVVWAAIEARNAYKILISRTDELVKSQFIEMFGEDKFPVCTLSKECDLITKGTTPTTIGFNFTDSGANFIKIENIDEHGNFIREGMMFISDACHEAMKRSQLKEDDILFSIAGAIGRCAVVPSDILPANINQALAIVRLKSGSVLDKKFVMAALQSDYVVEQYMELKRGVAQLNLSLKNIGDFKVPVPPMSEQRRYVQLVEHSDKSKFELQEAIVRIDNLIKSLIQQDTE